MPPLHQVVFSTHYEYYYTDVKYIQACQSKGKDYLKTPVTDRLHYYKKSIGEIRFFNFQKNFLVAAKTPMAYSYRHLC